MFLMNILFMLQLAVLHNNTFNNQSKDIPANILYIFFLYLAIAANICSYSNSCIVNID